MDEQQVIDVKVSPGARRDAICEWLGDTLKLRVRAAPERGKANAAVIRLLATHLGLPQHQVTVLSGHADRRKRIAIRGLAAAALAERLPHR